MSKINLLPAHDLILRALEKANMVHGRTVFASEIENILFEDDRRRLREKYAKPLKQALVSIIEMLDKRNLAFVKKTGKFKSFGAHSVLNDRDCKVPEAGESRRRIVLRAATAAVAELGRAVRTSDVAHYAKTHKLAIESRFITRDLINLAQTGELRIAGKIRSDGGGGKLYLPANFGVNEPQNDSPLTWLEYVKKHFFEIWKEHKEKAVDHLPHAITTAELNERLRSQEIRHSRLKCPKAVTNALKILSEGKTASVRRIKISATGAVLWIPAKVNNNAVLLFGDSGDNANKMSIALKRAEERLTTPVTTGDIKREIGLDFSLVPSGAQTVGPILKDLSKQKISGNRERRMRVTSSVIYAGSANGNAYYVSRKEMLPEAEDYLAFLTVRNKLQKVYESENLEAEHEFRLAEVRYGRIKLFNESLNKLRMQILTILAKNNMRFGLRTETEDWLRKTEFMVNESFKWLRGNIYPDLPDIVDKYTAGWTADNLIKYYRHYYPLAKEMKDPNRIIRLYGRYLRRIENPALGFRFTGGIESCEYLFDKTDALIHAAIKWGGNNMRFHALIAKHELGILRDFRFVLPALKSENYETRRTAVICLMFLHYPETFEHIFNIAVTDENMDVRQTAILAYAFCNGKKLNELLEFVENEQLAYIIKNGEFPSLLYL